MLELGLFIEAEDSLLELRALAPQAERPGTARPFYTSGSAVTASHFGWFDLPTKSINTARALGIAALVAGILPINRDWL